MKQMFNKKLKNILAVLLLVLFVVSLTASAASAGKVVSLSALQRAAANDPYGPQGATTPGAVDSVKIVEAALVKAKFLADNSYAKDGSYGTATIKAYKKWQKSLGSAEKYCDGIPGKKDLTKLGNKYGFTVDTSKISYQDLKITDKNLNALNQGKWAVYSGTSYPSKLLVYGSAKFDVPSKCQRSIWVGSINAISMTDYVGSKDYWGECVSFAKALSKSTLNTNYWIKGRNVVSSGNVKPGTVIATFGSNGKYLNKRGYSHTAIFREYVRDSNWKIIGFSVWDQNYVKTGIVGRHDIRSGTKTSEATNYYVVQV